MIKGNSTSCVERVGNYIYKWDTINPERLNKQIEKQKIFSKNFSEYSSDFIIPRVWDSGYLTKYKMPFYQGKDIIEYFQTESIHKIKKILTKLFLFINECSIQSRLNIGHKEILIEKLRDIGKNVNIKLIPQYNNLLEYLETFDIGYVPIDICHGDLTFSNIILSDEIVLIDFLNTYYETPIQDVTKLMQEIHLKWSLLKYNKECDKTKINIIYNILKKELSQKIDDYCEKYYINPKTIWVFYIITLLRLIPYTKELFIIESIKKELENAESHLHDGR